MGNTTVEIIFTYEEVLNNVKNAVIGFFPGDFFIKLTMIAMALVVGYGVNRLMTDDDKKGNVNK